MNSKLLFFTDDSQETHHDETLQSCIVCSAEGEMLSLCWWCSSQILSAETFGLKRGEMIGGLFALESDS